MEFFEVIEDYGYGDANHWGYFQNRENAEAKAAELIQRYWDEYPADYVPLIIHRVKILTHSMTD